MEATASRAGQGQRLIRGTLLAESLRPGISIGGHGMRIVRCSRYEVTGAAADQPPVWTAIEFDAPAEEAGALAQALSESLLSPGWYVNWTDGDESTIVFPGTVFRYRRGDLQARAAAQEHGRQCGVPEAQLDWTD